MQYFTSFNFVPFNFAHINIWNCGQCPPYQNSLCFCH